MYFPDNKEDTLEIGESYTLTLENKSQTSCQTTRVVNIFNKTSREQVHQAKHIHFQKWDDFSVPDEECVGEIMQILEDQSSLLMDQIQLMRADTFDKAKPQKILTHCRAGRGRTGTALSIINAKMTLMSQMQKLEATNNHSGSSQNPNSTRSLPRAGHFVSLDSLYDLKLSIFSIVRRIREQRATAVETAE